MDIDTILSKIEELNHEIQKDCELISANQCGLDCRCGSVVICDDYVGSKNQRHIEYYGGFEYIDAEDKLSVGEWTYYFANSERIARCIDTWESNNE